MTEQEIRPPQGPEANPDLPRYHARQGQIAVVKLEPTDCRLGVVGTEGLTTEAVCRFDGAFIVPIAADAVPGAYWVTVAGRKAAELQVVAADFSGTRGPGKPRSPSERLERDKQRKAEAFTTHFWTPTQEHLVLPLWAPVSSSYRISDAFGPHHPAVDIAAPVEGGWNVNAPDVWAIGPGLVMLSESLLLEGETIIVYHGDGLYISYCHLAYRNVKEGDRVSAGARLGTIGSTGEANGIHLHLTLRIGDVLVDPLDGIATLNNSLYLNAR